MTSGSRRRAAFAAERTEGGIGGIGDKTNIEHTFDDIYRQYEPGLFTKGEHLRGTEDGTLYLHGLFSISNKGEQALKERQQKWEQGSENVRQTIDRDYGEGVGEKIFQKISNRIDRDLSKELLRGDLPLIRSELQRLEKTPLKSGLDENQRMQSKVFGGEKGTVTRSEKMDGILTEMFGPRLRTTIYGASRRAGRLQPAAQPDRARPAGSPQRRPGLARRVHRPDGPDPTGAFKSIQVTAYLDREGGSTSTRTP